MTVKTVQETTKVHRPTVIEIQGLRGVAIMAVLLFHLWDKTFEVGYLGVDIFFVISGYLMCMLLNAKAPLSFTHIVDFYFRRIKRIIPTYLFVIYCCLFAAIFLISSTDYRDLVSEAKKPLLYISNWPDTPEDDYFAEWVSFLIAILIAIGYLIEEMFKSLSKWLSNWFRLLAVVCVLYLANGVTLWYLKSNEIGFNINATQRENGPEMEIRMKAIEFFENRKKPIETDPSHLLKYSRDFSEAALHFWYCNKSIGWQSNYKEFSKMGHLANNSCTVTDGNGTKTIVVFGNSHARTYMPVMFNVSVMITEIFRASCMRFETSTQTSLFCFETGVTYWTPRRIKLIIGLTYGAPDTEPYDQIENDPIYRKLEKDLAALSAVARDVVMLPNVQLMTGIDSYISKWRNKISNKESLDGFKFPIKASLKNRPRSREHLSKVNCSKCAKMNWEDLWCNRTTGMCNSIDPVSHLNYFYDQHHPTYFGSMFVGQFFRKRYDQWLNEHSNLTDYFKSDVANTTTIHKTLK
ncbi:Acyl-transf-3 domain-containing protein [Aphelenchoides besseyi]|nr:Acyl-transf-3 domain-containing protein [Aphelenchoides besseyi]